MNNAQEKIEFIAEKTKPQNNAAEKFERTQEKDGTHQAVQIYGKELTAEATRNDEFDFIHSSAVHGRDGNPTQEQLEDRVEDLIHAIEQQRDEIAGEMASNMTTQAEREGLREAYRVCRKILDRVA